LNADPASLSLELVQFRCCGLRLSAKRNLLRLDAGYTGRTCSGLERYELYANLTCNLPEAPHNKRLDASSFCFRHEDEQLNQSHTPCAHLLCAFLMRTEEAVVATTGCTLVRALVWTLYQACIKIALYSCGFSDTSILQVLGFAISRPAAYLPWRTH